MMLEFMNLQSRLIYKQMLPWQRQDRVDSALHNYRMEIGDHTKNGYLSVENLTILLEAANATMFGQNVVRN